MRYTVHLQEIPKPQARDEIPPVEVEAAGVADAMVKAGPQFNAALAARCSYRPVVTLGDVELVPRHGTRPFTYLLVERDGEFYEPVWRPSERAHEEID